MAHWHSRSRSAKQVPGAQHQTSTEARARVPTYQYSCTACSADLEVVQSFSDDALTECPSCAGRLRKRFGAVGIVFKGSGFYKTDSRGSSASEKAATDGGSSTDGKPSDGKAGDAKSADGKSDTGSGGTKADAATGSDSAKRSASTASGKASGSSSSGSSGSSSTRGSSAA